MDGIEQLIGCFARAGASSARKLDLLLDLGPLSDARVTPFLLRVLADAAEPMAVRLAVLRAVRARPLRPAERVQLAQLACQLASDAGSSQTELRVQSALALGELVDVDGVTRVLGALSADVSEHFDVRYSAFTSLERAGPTPECVALLRQLEGDDTLGRSARGILHTWRVDSPRTL